MRRKKLLFPIILFSLSICGCSPVSNTDNGNNGGQDNGENGNNNNEKKFELDFSNCIASIQDARSLKISRKSTSNNQIKRTKSSSSESFLYKNTEDYESAIEVSFIRYTTTIATEEVAGESVYTANPSHGEDRGFILIYASESFTYSVFDKKDREIVTNIQDNSQGDSDERIGFIRIGNLIPNNDYLVKYKGYREVEEITQDTLEAEIDKLYVYSSQFTFVSFVPKGDSQRPSDDKLSFDKDGISFYDKENYTNQEFRKSFVFDNYSGFIYSLENLQVTKLDGGLAIVNNEYCDLSINDNGSLLITPIVKNKTLNVHSAFKDKYNNKYVLNEKLETYDSKTNTFYFAPSSNYSGVPFDESYIYFLTTSKEVIRLPYFFHPDNDVSGQPHCEFNTMDLMLSNGSRRPIDESDSFEFCSVLVEIDTDSSFKHEPIKIENGVLAIRWGYLKNESNKFISSYPYFNYVFNYGETIRSYDLLDCCSIDGGIDAINTYFINKFDVLFMHKSNKIYSLMHVYEFLCYFYEHYFYINDWNEITVSSVDPEGKYFKELIQGVSIENGKPIKYTPDGNVSYDVYVEGDKENPNPIIYKTGTYTPQEPEELAIIIQPINRE